MITMQPIPSRILCDPQRQPKLRAQLLQLGNGAVCEGRDALGVKPSHCQSRSGGITMQIRQLANAVVLQIHHSRQHIQFRTDCVRNKVGIHEHGVGRTQGGVSGEEHV